MIIRFSFFGPRVEALDCIAISVATLTSQEDSDIHPEQQKKQKNGERGVQQRWRRRWATTTTTRTPFHRLRALKALHSHWQRRSSERQKQGAAWQTGRCVMAIFPRASAPAVGLRNAAVATLKVCLVVGRRPAWPFCLSSYQAPPRRPSSVSRRRSCRKTSSFWQGDATY